MSRGFLPCFKLANDTAMSASFNSAAVTVTNVNRVSFNISTASVTAGTGTFQVQHRHYIDANNYSDWATLTLDSTPTMAAANATFYVDVNVTPGQLRIKYTAASTPDGTCDIWVSGVEG